MNQYLFEVIRDLITEIKSMSDQSESVVVIKRTQHDLYDVIVNGKPLKYGKAEVAKVLREAWESTLPVIPCANHPDADIMHSYPKSGGEQFWCSECKHELFKEEK